MGIPGLTKYLRKFLRDHELKNSIIIIEGNNIASLLYFRYFDNCFGGDYIDYVNCYENFFNTLKNFEVTPIIVFSGDTESKNKVEECYNTIQKKIHNFFKVPNGQEVPRRVQPKPLFLKTVFLHTAKKKGIICIKTLFEAFSDIASLAKYLKCPVLSFDSNFFIYDVEYIPFDTLCMKNISNQQNSIKCKIFKANNMLEEFPKIDRTSLPLVAVLLGHDYSQCSFFQDLLAFLPLENSTLTCVFEWLKYNTLNTAISKILCKNKGNHQLIIETFEKLINRYLVPSYSLINHLYSNYEKSIDEQIFGKPYKFNGYEDLNNTYESTIDNKNDPCNNIETKFLLENSIDEPENELYKILPSWFLRKFHDCEFPSYFINILTEKPYFCKLQMEDLHHPTSINVSLNIIRTIFKLLTTGTTNCNELTYVTRGDKDNIKTCRLECNDLNLPSLNTLEDLDIEKKKTIFLNTMQVSDRYLEEFPPEWRLYIATIIYWRNEDNRDLIDEYHLNSLLFVLIVNVVNGDKFTKSDQKEETGICRSFLEPMSISDALNNLQKEEYSFVQRFSKLHSKKDKRKICVKIIHGFELFQNALHHCMHLNALLGYPYPKVNVAFFLYGTLMYNLYKTFKRRSFLFESMDDYIRSDVFRSAPSIFCLFDSILERIIRVEHYS